MSATTTRDGGGRAVGMQAAGLRVAELAGAVGVKPDTIRFYERAGLLPPPARTAAGYRAYEPGAVDRLRTHRKSDEHRGENRSGFRGDHGHTSESL